MQLSLESVVEEVTGVPITVAKSGGAIRQARFGSSVLRGSMSDLGKGVCAGTWEILCPPRARRRYVDVRHQQTSWPCGAGIVGRKGAKR